MSVNGLGGASGVNMQNIQSMDIETALMMVQSERTKMLDTQLQTQIQEVQNRNAQIAHLNNVLSGLNAASGMFKSDADPTATLDTTDGWKDQATKNYPVEREMNSAMNAANVNLKLTDAADGALTNDLDANGNEVRTIGGMTTKGQIEKAITDIKGMIDSAGNSSQTDMLRLQSLSNKRNEAFDVMTNFVKKMQDSRSSIIGNMR